MVLLSKLLETKLLPLSHILELIPPSWKVFTALRKRGNTENQLNFFSRTSAALLLLSELEPEEEQMEWDKSQKSVLIDLNIHETVVDLIRESGTPDIKKKSANALRILSEKAFAIREVFF